MSKIHWLNPVDGLFTDAADWKKGVVPGASDDAVLNAKGADYTVTVLGLSTVNSIQVGSNVTLAITGSLVAPAGTGTGGNAGNIILGTGGMDPNGAVNFYIGGRFDNSGSVVLDDSTADGNSCTLGLESNTTLTGGGTIVLANTPGNFITGEVQATLINVSDTISGNGAFAGDLIALINKSRGVINANGSALSFGTGEFISNLENDGLLEASGTRQGYFDTLNIGNTVVTGAHGVINGAAGGQVVIGGCTVTGQTLSTQADGRIVLSASVVSVGGPISNAGTLWLENTGVLSLSESATLTGGGGVLLDFSTALITANKAATLTNVDNVIYGVGSIGGGKLSFVNQAGGIVEAENFGAGYDERIVIDTGRNTIVNAGLIEAGANAIVALRSAISNTGVLAASGGKLRVEGAVTGSGDASIAGGTLSFRSSFDEAVTFTDGSGVLKLAQSQSYTGTITGFSVEGGTSLDLRDIGFVDAGEATFSGTATAGVLTVTDGVHSAHIDLVGDYLGATFTARRDSRGGTTVVATTGEFNAQIRSFAAAMATLTASPAQALRILGTAPLQEPLVSSPKVQMV